MECSAMLLACNRHGVPWAWSARLCYWHATDMVCHGHRVLGCATGMRASACPVMRASIDRYLAGGAPPLIGGCAAQHMPVSLMGVLPSTFLFP
eukprot:361337-Chlamydomonas_euryale.AAC.1